MSIKKPAAGWKIQRATTSPGEMLVEEFLKPMGLSQNQLAIDIKVPANRIGQIVSGRRNITPDTALRLSRYFGNSAEFWLNLQLMYDLSKARVEDGRRIEQEVKPAKIA